MEFPRAASREEGQRATGEAGPRLIFDHVYKTGGFAASQAIAAALPTGEVSPHLHPSTSPVPLDDYGKWHHLIGHFGVEHRSRIKHFRSAVTATMVRDPAATVISTYTYWRHNIPRAEGPHVALAHDLSFAEFIRAEEMSYLLNGQSTFLAGVPRGNPQRFARRALAPYRIIGTTDNLVGFLETVLGRVAPGAAPRAGELLADVHTNASLGQAVVTPDDRDYLEKRQVFDHALYGVAKERSERQPSRLSHIKDTIMDAFERRLAGLIRPRASDGR